MRIRQNFHIRHLGLCSSKAEIQVFEKGYMHIIAFTIGMFIYLIYFLHQTTTILYHMFPYLCLKTNLCKTYFYILVNRTVLSCYGFLFCNSFCSYYLYLQYIVIVDAYMYRRKLHKFTTCVLSSYHVLKLINKR